LVLAISLDGRLAPAEGGAAQLGGPGDRRRLEEALAWADAVLMGAQTLRLHGCSCLIHAEDLIENRRRLGLSSQPPVVVWSRRGQISADLPFFRQPFERWLLKAEEPATDPPAAAEGFRHILPFEDWPRALATLGALGVERVAVLGGAQLAAALVAAKLLDELQLTLCPTLLGGPNVWLPADAWSDPSMRWALMEHQQLEGGEQLLHYGRLSAP
jgi:5-amino-6-(5-phosphoribosylamino)uracil reductase